MIKFLRFIPFQLTFVLALGILTGFYVSFPPTSIFVLLFVLLLVLFAFFRQANNSFKQTVNFSATALSVFYFIGIAAVTIQNDLNHPTHYTKHLQAQNSIIVIIDEVLKPGVYYDKYYASISQIGTQKVQGKILLNVVKNSVVRPFKEGNRLLVNSNFKEVKAPLNPYGFNYKSYLEKQNIYHQVFVSKGTSLMLPTNKTTLQDLAVKLRNTVYQALEKFGFKGDELAVVNALLLGQRQEISKELLQSYAGAGAIHILAVSGLHVGIILLILNFILRPLEQLRKGKFIKMFLVIMLLWGFAFIAGMSSSVVRAVTMFTAVAVGMAMNRPSNVYNTLVISMFFLLLIHPYYLFDVGFQLSYLAVFFIVWIQPLLYEIWRPNIKLIDYFWKLFTVSLAAQFGVVPISLYYFHQFPGLFMISNLVIVPFLGMILIGGVFIIVLAVFDCLPLVFAQFYEGIIYFMNSFVKWVAHQEMYLIQNISFSLPVTIAFYILIVTGFRWLQDRTINKFTSVLGAVILVQLVFVFEKRALHTKDTFVVFHKSRNSVMAFKRKEVLAVYSVLKQEDPSINKMLNSYAVGLGVEVFQENDTVQNVFRLGNDTFLVVDSLGVYRLKNMHAPIVLLKDSPKINLERLIEEIQPKKIIADGSNYKSFVERWKRTSQRNKISFHYTGEKGALVYEKVER